jgi:mannose-6-phosphate isomerase-like protein (cupin superfamily)
MTVRKVSLDDIEPMHLSGRDLRWIVTPETIGAESLSIAIMNCFPKSVVKPLHSHKDIEEVILILDGQGEAWVDGHSTTFKKGDAVLFPPNSRHQVRNTGDKDLVTASIFSKPTGPDSYVIYEEDAFSD